MTGPGETRLREAMVMHGQSLHQRGLVPGTSGNISVRLDGGMLVTPTNCCLGRLDPADIAHLDASGKHLSGNPASKESFMHRQYYRQRPDLEAVVHLHSTHAVAVSCLSDINPLRPLPMITPYQVMKLGALRLLPYFPPGDSELAEAVGQAAGKHHALLLANHGPLVAGRTLDAAVYAMEELEESARLYLLLKTQPFRGLNSAQVDHLMNTFPS